MCLEGMPSLVPGVLSLLVVAVRDIMSAISQQDDHVKVLVSLLVEKSRNFDRSHSVGHFCTYFRVPESKINDSYHLFSIANLGITNKSKHRVARL